MFFRDVVGQEVVKWELIRSFQEGIVPHARLFVGEDGMGGLGIALAYARYINCDRPSKLDSCGTCPSCKRYNQFAGQDLFFLFPIVNQASRNYCEDELPQWRAFLTKGPHTRYQDWLEYQGGDAKKLGIFAREGEQITQRLSYQIAEARYRVLLIWLPEKMHEALSNKLLKLTEEPPERTVILMVTQEEAKVLATLRSRMQPIYLRAIKEETIRDTLCNLSDGQSVSFVQDIAHLSRGNFRTALDLYQGGSVEEQNNLELFKKILRATVDAQPTRGRAIADEVAKLSREEQINLLGYISQLFRELFVANYELMDIVYVRQDERPLIDYIKACINRDNVARITTEIDLAIVHIGQNVNSKMVIFDLILRLTSILAPSYKERGIR